MNPARSGLSTSGKVGVLVVLVLLVLGGAYLAPSFLAGGTRSTSSQSAGSSTSSGEGNQAPASGLLSLFGAYSRMQVETDSYDHTEAVPLIDQHSHSYVVLGKATLNSTRYILVQFSQPGANTNAITWFNPKGGVDRVDILGDRNYTGRFAYIYVQLYVGAFSFLVGLPGNTTILSMLKQTTQETASVGPTQLVLTTYTLAAPTDPFVSVTARLATIPGTSTSFVVYYDQETSDSMENVYQVVSLAK